MSTGRIAPPKGRIAARALPTDRTATGRAAAMTQSTDRTATG